MPKNELPLVISYLTAAAGLVWILLSSAVITSDRIASGDSARAVHGFDGRPL